METLRVPIYLSSDVIFPGQLLPVYGGSAVERMVHVCRKIHYPIGVVLSPDSGIGQMARVGTLANLLDAEEGLSLEGNGTANAVLVGQSRFRVLDVHADRIYPEATVELWPWLEEPRPTWILIEQLGEYLRRYIHALSDTLPPTLLPEALVPDSATLGVLGAALLQLSPDEKQRLLELPTSQALLSSMLKYMRIYVPLAERLAAIPPCVTREYESISLN